MKQTKKEAYTRFKQNLLRFIDDNPVIRINLGFSTEWILLEMYPTVLEDTDFSISESRVSTNRIVTVRCPKFIIREVNNDIRCKTIKLDDRTNFYSCARLRDTGGGLSVSIERSLITETKKDETK